MNRKDQRWRKRENSENGVRLGFLRMKKNGRERKLEMMMVVKRMPKATNCPTKALQHKQTKIKNINFYLPLYTFKNIVLILFKNIFEFIVFLK